MPLDRIKAGSSLSVSTEFTNDDGTPFSVDVPVRYQVRDFNRNLVVEGTAAQDNSNLAKWSATITIPSNAPVGEDFQRYTLQWTAQRGKEKLRNTEHFSVTPANAYPFAEIDILVPEGSALSDVIKVSSEQEVTNLRVSVVTPDGNPIYMSEIIASPASSVEGDEKLVVHNTPPIPGLSTGGSVFACYVVVWAFHLDGVPTLEHHFVYVVNPKTLAYVNELNRMINKANIAHPNPALRYNNVDLVAALNLGLQRVNSSPPTVTGYTLANIPDQMYWYVLNAAAYVALSSRLLAEGEAAFDFQGQPISLTVDRTGYLESAMERFRANLDDLAQVKKGIIMAGIGRSSGGVLVLSRGPALNNIGDRTAFYQSFISTFNQIYDTNTGTYIPV